MQWARFWLPEWGPIQKLMATPCYIRCAVLIVWSDQRASNDEAYCREASQPSKVLVSYTNMDACMRHSISSHTQCSALPVVI